MVSIKTIATGLSTQIERAIKGEADAVQAEVLCKSVDTLIKLARLQIEMGAIDWSSSDEKPVIEMEKSIQLLQQRPVVPGQMQFTVETMTEATEEDLKAEIKRWEVELSHQEVAMNEAADGSGDFIKHEKACKLTRKYIRDLRDELENR